MQEPLCVSQREASRDLGLKGENVPSILTDGMFELHAVQPQVGYFFLSKRDVVYIINNHMIEVTNATVTM